MVESGVHYTGFFQKMQWRVKIFRERSLPWGRKLPCGLEHAGAQGLLRKNLLGGEGGVGKFFSGRGSGGAPPSFWEPKKGYRGRPLGYFWGGGQGKGRGRENAPSFGAPSLALGIYRKLCDAAQLDQFSELTSISSANTKSVLQVTYQKEFPEDSDM